MFKKTLISLAVASSLGLTGCFDSGSDSKNANPSPNYTDPSIDGKTWPIFNPTTGAVPLPNDFIFRQDNPATTNVREADGTFEVANTKPPVTAALNQLSGASTVAPVVIQTNGQLEAGSVEAGKTVHLIEMEYASGDPVQGLGNKEPGAPVVALDPTAELPKVRAEVVTLDGTSAIRIVPLEPLKPQKRYIVLITTGVKDINGDSIIQDPVYTDITRNGPDAPILSSRVAPIRTLTNSLWEPSAIAYSKVLAATGAIDAPVTEDDIALTYSFTTSNDGKVLQYIAEPGTWFADQIRGFVATSAAKKAIANGAKSYPDIATAVTTAINTFPQSIIDPESPPPELLLSLVGPGEVCGPNPETGFIGQAVIDCLGIGLATNFKGSLPTPTQEKRAGSIKLDAPEGVAAISLVAASVLEDPTSVLTAQGTIKLPNYLGNSPAELVGATRAGDMLGNWVADDELANDISDLLALVGAPPIPQAIPEQTKTTAVNYIFPFPKLNAEQPEIEAPILILYPSNPATPIQGVVSFQHGITTDRSTALTFGSALAEQGYIVAAIDHPLHGVSPFSAEEQIELSKQLIEAAVVTALLEPFPFDDLEELKEVNPVAAGEIKATASGIADILASEAVNSLEQETQAAQVNFFVQKVIEVEQSRDPGEPGALTGFDPTAETPEVNEDFINTVGSLLATIENAGSQIPGLAPRFEEGESEETKVLVERHFGLFPGSSGKPQMMNFDKTSPQGIGGNGRFFINLQNFLKTRDNLRQSSVDQMNLRAALAGLEELTYINPDDDSTFPSPIPSDVEVFFAGHSLGGITGVPYLNAVNTNALSHPSLGEITFFPVPESSPAVFSNENDVSAASLLASGGGIVRLLENSRSFAPQILGGLLSSEAALEQGDSSMESFFNVAQATVDSADPINFIASMTVPTLVSMVIGDEVIPNAADPIWANDQYGESYDPAPLSGMVPGFPLEVRSFRAPLAGTVPLIELGNEDLMVMDYQPETFTGVNHGTPVDPTSSKDAFGGMVCSTLITFESSNQPSYCSPQD